MHLTLGILRELVAAERQKYQHIQVGWHYWGRWKGSSRPYCVQVCSNVRYYRYGDESDVDWIETMRRFDRVAWPVYQLLIDDEVLQQLNSDVGIPQSIDFNRVISHSLPADWVFANFVTEAGKPVYGPVDNMFVPCMEVRFSNGSTELVDPACLFRKKKSAEAAVRGQLRGFRRERVFQPYKK